MKNPLCKIKDDFNKGRELKALFILGLLCLIHIIINVFTNESETNAIDVAIRSQLVGIFGYIFCIQSNCTISYRDRDTQFCIAFMTALLCLIALMLAKVMGAASSIPSLATLRDLLATSIGFLIGQSKNNVINQ